MTLCAGLIQLAGRCTFSQFDLSLLGLKLYMFLGVSTESTQ